MNLTERARQIIERILYITIASVGEDGLPWNTPVYSSFDERYTFFWVSSPESQHSKNIKANPDVFLVIYDSTVAEGTGEGVYIKAKAYEMSDESEITKALMSAYGRKNKEPRSAHDFLGNNPHRVYKAIPEKVWMNTDEKIEGHHVDKRVEIEL